MTRSGGGRRRRSRRAGVVLLLAVVLAVLAGRGLGLVGTVPAGPAATLVADQEAEGLAAVEARGAALDPAAESSAGTHQPAPPAAVGRATPARDPALPRGDRAAVADRLGSLLSLFDARIGDGRLGLASAALDAAAALDLDDEQRAVLAACRAALQQHAAESGARLSAALARGDALAAHALAAAWLADGEPAGAALLAAACCGAGLEGDPSRPIPAAGGPAPAAPRPLQRGRRVELHWRGGLQVGEVVDSRGDRVTVRLRTARGQSFPTVARTAVQPVEPHAEEAVEMGFAALEAGEALLARLWLAVARLRDAGGGARQRMLRDLLQ